MTIKQLKLYYHTLKYVKPVQIRYQLYYRMRKEYRKIVKFHYVYSLPSTTTKLVLEKSIENIHSYNHQHKKEFRFLNISYQFTDIIDWNFPDFGKLWTYNLNYFDYLNQVGMDVDDGKVLIQSFIENISTSKDGLEPFPIALRGINWIKFLTYHRVEDQNINDSLYAQYHILLDNLEYHLLGNHLLENGFSLLFGAYYFQDQQLFDKAKDILLSELQEQILEDGAHFELTPMYHQIMLFRVLDCVNLLKHNNIFEANFLLEFLEQKASLMLGWLKNMTYENGNVPHFNDSTNGITPVSQQLFDYAKLLGIIPITQPLGASGYRKFVKDKYELVVDVGNIGPDYIPGHAHSDTFNFELHILNKPVIIDTGISTYEANTRRKIERSTAAHNTVVINHINQSEVWSSFRVANRAKIIALEEDRDEISATHDGYADLGFLHTRTFYTDNDQIVIKDKISNKYHKKYNAIAYFHLHENISDITIKNDRIITNNAIFSFIGSKTLKIVDTTIAAGFNKTDISQCIEVYFDDNLKTIINIRT